MRANFVINHLLQSFLCDFLCLFLSMFLAVGKNDIYIFQCDINPVFFFN